MTRWSLFFFCIYFYISHIGSLEQKSLRGIKWSHYTWRYIMSQICSSLRPYSLCVTPQPASALLIQSIHRPLPWPQSVRREGMFSGECCGCRVRRTASRSRCQTADVVCPGCAASEKWDPLSMETRTGEVAHHGNTPASSAIRAPWVTWCPR